VEEFLRQALNDGWDALSQAGGQLIMTWGMPVTWGVIAGGRKPGGAIDWRQSGGKMPAGAESAQSPDSKSGDG
jgi:hypothetical protein